MTSDPELRGVSPTFAEPTSVTIAPACTGRSINAPTPAATAAVRAAQRAALAAAGIAGGEAEELDQDAVAASAGTTVSATPDTSVLPRGESGRRDYRIAPPLIDDADTSGTNAPGLVRAIEALARGALAAVP